MSILVLGGTGKVGNRVISQLLNRNTKVKAIVRSPQKLSSEQQSNPLLTISEADLTALTMDDLSAHLVDVTAVISCLGHTPNFKGILFEELFVKDSAMKVVKAINSLQPVHPIKFIHLSTSGITNPTRNDKRGWFEAAFLSALYVMVPMRDSQQTADFLTTVKDNQYVEWVAVRPEWFAEGPVSAYELQPSVTYPVLNNGTTRMSNVADFMCNLAETPTLWSEWKGRMPIIKDVK